MTWGSLASLRSVVNIAALITGGGVPVPPSGFTFITRDGAYLTRNGAYLLKAA